MQPREAYLGGPRATAHIENPPSCARLHGIADERGERVVPPALPKVFQCWRRENINFSCHRPVIYRTTCHRRVGRQCDEAGIVPESAFWCAHADNRIEIAPPIL